MRLDKSKCIVFLLALIYGCFTSDEMPNRSPVWELKDVPDIPKNAGYSSYAKSKTPVVFGPGSFDWQPEEKTVIFHSHEEGIETRLQIGERLIELNRSYDFRLITHFDRNTVDITNTSVWIAVEEEALNLEEALHFFECRYFRSGRFSFGGLSRWTHGYLNARCANDNELWFVFDSSRVNSNADSYWRAYHDRCTQEICVFRIHIWMPQSGAYRTDEVVVKSGMSDLMNRMANILVWSDVNE